MTEAKKTRNGTATVAIAGAVAVIVLGGFLWRNPAANTPVATASAAAPIAASVTTPASAAAPEPSASPATAASDTALDLTQAAASTKQASAKKAPAKADAPGQPVKTLGSKNAPIVMEVFTDYMCPACKNLFEQTLRPMINDYVASGKVLLIHHDFPLNIPQHVYSYEAARWATAASEIGKFEEVDGALYDNQAVWSADGNIEKIISGVLNQSDFARVKKLMNGCSYEVQPLFKLTASGEAAAGQSCSLDTFIEADKALGNKVPVQQTPTYVITNKGNRLAPGAGYVSWPILKQFFDSLN